MHPSMIKKRLSEMWTGDADPKANFGVDDNEPSKSVVGGDRNFTEIQEEDLNKFDDERLTANLDQPSQLEDEVSHLLNDTSHNASPPTVGGGGGGYQVNKEFRNAQRCLMDSPPTLQVNPIVIYSDDRMQIFANNDSGHLQTIDDRIARESYSPFLGTSEESISSSKIHIFKSRFSTNQNESHPQSKSSRPRQRFKRKRRSKKNCEWSTGMNQNNSDDSNEGSEDSNGRASASSRQRNTQSSGSFIDDREHNFVCYCSSTESDEEVENVSQSGSRTGVWSTASSGSKHKLGESGSQVSTRNTQPCDDFQPRGDRRNAHNDMQYTEGGDMPTSNSHDPFQSFDCREWQRQFSFKFYEVHHPDEPYPYRLTRSKRKARDSQEQSGSDKIDCNRCEKHESEEDCRRSHERSSVAAETERSADTSGQNPRSPNTSPQHPQHLEGGGEGAAAATHNEVRKSARDVLLRRAMENSFIQATTGLDFRRSVCPNTGQPHTDERWGSESFRQMSPVAQNGTRENESIHQLESIWQENQDPMDVAARQATSTPIKSQMNRSGQSSMSRSRWESSSNSSDSPSPHPKSPRRTRSKSGLHSPKRTSSNLCLEGRSTDAQDSSVSEGHQNISDSSEGLKQVKRQLSRSSESPSQRFHSPREESSCSHVVSSDFLDPGCSDDFTSFDPRQFSCCSDAARAEEKQECRYQKAEEGNSSTVFSSFDARDRSHWRRMCKAHESENSGYFGNELFEGSQYSFHSPYRSTRLLDQPDAKKMHGTKTDAVTELPVRNSADSPSTSKGKRTLKSAMKQHSSMSKLSPSVEKKRPPRRVSFSEPQTYQHSEINVPLEDVDPGVEGAVADVRQFDSISQRVGGPEGMQRHSKDIRCGPFGALDLDAFFSALPSTSTSGSTQRERGKNSPRSTVPTAGMKTKNSSMTTSQMESLWQRDVFQFPLMESASSEGQAPKKHSAPCTESSEAWCSAVELQPQGKVASPRSSDKGSDCHQNRPQILEPPLLVDIEPHGNNSSIKSEREMVMPREEAPASWQFLRLVSVCM